MDKPERLVPFDRLQDDYYVGDSIRDGGGHNESEEEESSDDEVQSALKEMAGYGPDHNCAGEKTRGKTEFEQEMDDELDDRMSDYVRATMRGEAAKGADGEEAKKGDDAMEEDADMPPLEDQSEGEERMVTSPVKTPKKSALKRRSEGEGKKGGGEEKKEADDVEMKEDAAMAAEDKKVKFAEPEPPKKKKEAAKKEEEEEEYSSSSEEEEEEGEGEEDNPIKAAARAFRKEAREARKKEKSSKTLPDFYNPSEDDENEEWVQKRRRSSQGKEEKKEGQRKVNPKQIRLEGGSDAVLSCPGCMVMLTRDCQRHEVYKDQYRAMFVENCRVDEEEALTVEKTGKEKRRERQRRRKEGGPEVAGASADDVFKPVRCAVCTTKVAVMDHDEIYHFFNVLAGYS